MHDNVDKDLLKIYSNKLIEYANKSQYGIPTYINSKMVYVGRNHLCGDEITIRVVIEEKYKLVKHIYYQAKGCSLCLASAYLMSLELQNCPLEYPAERYEDIEYFINPECQCIIKGLLEPLAGVRKFPSRQNCILLPWYSAVEAVKQEIEAYNKERKKCGSKQIKN